MATNLATRIRRRRRPARLGAALVEFALIAPLLISFFFASIELSRLNMIRNSASIAAYEGCRRGIIPGSTAAQAEQAARDALATVGIVPQTVVVTPSTLTTSTDQVTITITILSSRNLWITPLFSAGATIVKTTTLSREKTSND